MSVGQMSSEIDRVARTCVVIECNGMGIYCWCRAMRLPPRVSGAASIGPLGDGAMRLPPADVAASPGERFGHPGRQPHSTKTQSLDMQVRLTIAFTPAFLRGTLVLSLRPVA